MFDKKFTNLRNIERVILKISHDCSKYQTEYYGLNKKPKIAGNIGFVFNQKKKLTTNIYSNLSNINIHFFKISNPSYVLPFFFQNCLKIQIMYKLIVIN